MRLPAAALFAISLLASCYGGTSSLPSAGSSAGSSSQNAAHRGTGRVIVRIRVPARPRRVRVRVLRQGRPHYISASTVAMTLAISNGSKLVVNQTVPLTPSSAGCSTTSAGTACTTSVQLRACPTTADCYTASISTYDAIFCNGAPPVCSIPENANELSTGQSVPFTVATGVANTVSLTLSGVPHSVRIAPDALTNLTGGTYDLIGPGAHVFTVQTLDADGNALVGPGAPTLAVSAPSGSLAGVTVATPSSVPNQIWVSPPATFDGADSASFTVAPTFAGQTTDGCAQPQSNCAATTVTVGMEQMYAIANFSQLDLYALGESTPRVTSSINDAGLYGVGLASDGAGDIFVPGGTNAILNAAPLSSGVATTLPCCAGTTSAVAAGPNGDAYFLTSYQTVVGQQNVVSLCSATACSATTYVLFYNAQQSFAANAAGDLAYGDPNSNNQACFAYAYDAPAYNAPYKVSGSPMSATGCASLMALDPNGNLFAGDTGSGQIVEYSKSSGYQTATQISTGVSPVALITDSSGNVLDVAAYPSPSPGGFLLQETLSSSLSAHQGGSITPDKTATLPSVGYVPYATLAIGPNGVYVDWYPCCTYKPTLAGYSIPALAPLGTPINNADYSPSGLLVLP